ncbi:hypothetical protein V6N13_058167 [Hibiscus sabdariffa]
MANVEPNFLKIVSETEVVEAMLQFNRWEFDAFIRPYMSPGHITSLSEVGGCCHIVALDANTDRVFSVKLVRHSDYYLLMGSGVSAMIRQNIFVVGYEMWPDLIAKAKGGLDVIQTFSWEFCSIILRIDMIWFDSLSWSNNLTFTFISGLVPIFVLNGTLGDFLFGSNMSPALFSELIRVKLTPSGLWAAQMAVGLDTNGGSFVNYYMYHGGTNFGRTSGGPFIATSYDYDAPIDEYRQLREPKWGHLRDLHRAIKLCEPALVSADPTVTSLGSACAAFLANYDTKYSVNVTFGNAQYELPRWSISILPYCKTTVFNTARLGAKSSEKQIVPVTAAFSWQSYDEERPSTDDQNVGFGNRSLSVG